MGTAQFRKPTTCRTTTNLLAGSQLICILAAALFGPSAASAQTFDVPFSSVTPTIDGSLGAAEWAAASSNYIFMVHNNGVTKHSAVACFKHDGTWLYLGINSGFNNAPHLYWVVQFDGNNSHANDGNASEPHIDISVGHPGPGRPSYYSRYDANLASGSIVVALPAGTAKASAGSNPVTFEFKIKLAELGVSPGGVVGFKFQHGDDGSNGYGYPRMDPPMAEWPHLRILPRSLTDGLVAYYPFDGSANDASGNGNNGTAVNGPSYSTDAKGGAYSLNLDGVNDRIDVPVAVLYGRVDRTLSMWIKSTAASCTFIGDNQWGGCCPGTYMGITADGKLRGHHFNYTVYQDILLTSTRRVDDGQWHHVALSLSGTGGARLFVDGILEAANSIAAQAYSANHMSIGCHSSGNAPNYTEFYSGKIDEIRIYGRSLSATEVTQLYTLGGGTTPSTTLSEVHVQTNGTAIRVWYAIAGAFQTIPVATLISTNDGQSYNLAGPSSSAVAPGNACSLDWNPAPQLPNQINSHVRVRVIAGPAVAETPQPFTVDTRNLGTGPTVVNVRSRYVDNSRHVYFLSGIGLTEEFNAEVDWGTKAPGCVIWAGPFGYVTNCHNDMNQNGWVYKNSFNVGTWPVGTNLTVKAVALDGTETPPVKVNFEIVDSPPGIPLAVLYPVPLANVLKYQAPEFSFRVLDSGVKEPIDSRVPVFGGTKLGFLTAIKASVEVNGDGTANGNLSVGTGSELTIGPVGVEASVYGQPEYTYSPEKRQWILAGYVGIDVGASVSIGPAYVWFTPPVFFRLDLDMDNSTRLGIDGWDATGAPKFNGQWEFSAHATGVAGCGASGIAAVEGYLGGGPTWTVQYPQQPALKELGLELNGGVRVVLLFYTWDAGLLHYEWWFVKDTNNAALARYSAALANALNAPNSSEFKLMPRDYLVASTPYSAFLPAKSRSAKFWGDPVVAKIPLLLQTNIFPYSEPALGVSGTNRILLLVTDNPARSDENRTELVWSKWNGSTWVNPTSVWNDATADFAPAVKVFPDGKALAVWQNERAVLTNGATLDTALAGLEIAVGWFNPASNAWSCSNLTDNLTLDQGPKLDAGANGKALVTWISNPSNSPLGSVSEPNTIRSRFWDGAAWQNPGDIATNAGMLLWHTVAFNGTNGVMLAALDLDDDQSSITNQELYGATFNGTNWSAFTRLTTNNVQDTKPQAAFDSAGHLLVVWYQDTNLVMHTGDLNLSSPTVIGAVGGASSAKDFRLITGPAGQVTMLWEDVAEDGTGPDPFVFNYDYALNSWSKPVRLLQNTNLLERSFAGAYSDAGSLLLAYNQVNVQTDTNGAPIFTNNAVDLMYLDYAIGGDLAVSPGSLLLSTNNPQPGQTVQVSVLVQNAGEKAATNIAVAFYSGGTLIGATQTVAFLAAGATTNVTVNWTIPVGIAQQAVSVRVYPDGSFQDRNPANNSASLVALAPDLTISEMSVMNSAKDRRMVNARVVNQGNFACNAPFQVTFRRGSAAGPVIGTVPVEAIPASGQYDANLEWNLVGVTFTNAYETVYAVTDSAGAVAESDRSNNTNFVQVATVFDSDADGLADADELRYGTGVNTPDSDGDGLLDGDEVYRYGTSPLIADSDGDGVRDGDEVRAGTDPLSKDDVFAVVRTDATNGFLFVEWTAKSNKTYQVVKSLELLSWTNAPSGLGTNQQSLRTAITNGLLEYSEPVGATNASGKAFYRVKLVE
jgi:hypothetical protein